MNLASLLDPLGAHALEVAWLFESLAPVSDYGDRVFAALRPYAPGEEAAAVARARRIGAVADALELERLDAIREALRGAPDASAALARAGMGETLGDVNALELQRFLDAVERVDGLIAGVDALGPVGSAATQSLARVLERGRVGKFGFYLADSFDRELARVRAAAAAANAAFEAVHGRASAEIARALGREELPPDEFIVMRAEAPSVLPPGVRVVREAPTYLLCALSYDEPTRAALERREAASAAVETAEERVRAALTGEVRAHANGLARAFEAFGDVDVIVAAARFARAYRCCVPEIADRPALTFTGGRFLPLAARLEREGRAFSPIDVDLHDVAVLTGPNMGGKSVALRTCGFVALCAAFGLPVPATAARVGLFGEIAWLGIGAEGELGGLLSSFAKEVVRLRDTLARGTPRLLVLIDEFARTTTPREGKALLVALLRALQGRGTLGLVATHLGGVASAAGARHFAVRGLRAAMQPVCGDDLAAALQALAAAMDYTIELVDDDAIATGDAIELAALLGLDPEVIAGAREALRGPSGSFG